MRKLPRYEFKGEMLTAGEIAKATGRTQGLISQRLFSGIRGEALGDPPMSRSEAASKAKAAMHGGRACTPKQPRQRITQ